MFVVKFTPGSRKDLREIHDYIASTDSAENALYLVREIIRAAMTLRELPDRGVFPPELLRTGNRKYRQIFFKPYRILYRVYANTVHIAVIADGRRNMSRLLANRLRGS